VCQLICFDLTSKKLNLLAYIGTSKIQENWVKLGENRRDEVFWKLPSMLCSSWCCLLQTRSDHTWEASRKWLERLQGFGSWSSWISNSWDSNSNFKLKCIRFSFGIRGFQWGENLVRKVVFKWAQKHAIYSQMEWYLHTLKICPKLAMLMARVHGHVQAHDAMQKGPKWFQLRSEWSLNGKALWTEVCAIDSFQWCNHVKVMRRPSNLCPKCMNLGSLESLDQGEQV
jgi:hypothetical protein